MMEFIEKLVKFIRISVKVAVWLSVFIYILSFFSIFYAFYRFANFVNMCLRGRLSIDDFPVVIIYMLSDFLLAFVLIILARGVYQVIQKTSERGGEGLMEFRIQDIEKNFIGIIILTLLVVALGLILKPENSIPVFYISMGISALIISSAIYLYCSYKRGEGG